MSYNKSVYVCMNTLREGEGGRMYMYTILSSISKSKGMNLSE